MPTFICFSTWTCWQECEKTGEGYAECDGAIYSITLEGLPAFKTKAVIYLLTITEVESKII